MTPHIIEAFAYTLLLSVTSAAKLADTSLVDGVRNFQLVNTSVSGVKAFRKLEFRSFTRHFIVHLHPVELQGGAGILGQVDVFRLEVAADTLADVTYYEGRVVNRVGDTSATGFFSDDGTFDGQVIDDDGDIYYIRPIGEFEQLRKGKRANSVVYRESDSNIGDDSVLDLDGDDLLAIMPTPPTVNYSIPGGERTPNESGKVTEASAGRPVPQ